LQIMSDVVLHGTQRGMKARVNLSRGGTAHNRVGVAFRTPSDSAKLPTAARRQLVHRPSPLAPICLLLALTCNPQRADAQPTTTAAALKEQIDALVIKAALGPRVGLSVVDLGTGQTLFTHGASTPLNPASNLKLLTAATAMLELGPEFRSHTGLYGRIQDGAVPGGVCLKGQGDPTLSRADLVVLAQRLADEGVRSLDEVVIDGSYFDAAVLPPAFEQQPRETAPFRAAVSALSLNANAYTLHVRPGASEGAPAAISVEGSGYFELDDALTTGAQTITPSVSISERSLGDRVALSLHGVLPLAGATLAYARRVTSPLHYAGYVLVDALDAAGIRGAKHVRIAACPSDAPLIVLHASPALSEVLARMGKDSDNFVAEMVLKTLAAEHTHRPGSSADGSAIVQDTLKRLALPLDGLALVNGSGLYQGNRVTTQLVSRLLAAMYQNPSLRDDFIAHLAVGGVDGTLGRRFRELPRPRIVRAKTGTLDDVIALSGYVLGPRPERAFAFSYLANGVTGKHAQARDLIDHVVEAIAAYLYDGSVAAP
jgi:serine-type D-Ala-D-Ala carboxypeptidase/endopeptidase (penicillin-binding protein 4)